MSRNNQNARYPKRESKFSIFIVSVVIAVVIWALVSATQTTEAERTITGVPVQIQMSEEFTEETGLSIYGDSSFSVDVTVKGQSYLINSSKFGADSIVLTASVSSVAVPGSYDLPITASAPSKDVEIVKLSASTVTVEFDEPVTKTFPLSESVTEGEGYSLAEGLIRENPTLSRDTIDISGPSKEIAKITAVKAVAELTEEITATTKVEASIVFEADEAELDDSNIKVETEDAVFITIPVSSSGVFDVKVDFSGVPADYRESGIEYKINPPSADIVFSSGSYSSIIDEDGKINVGTIDFSKINNEVNYIKVTNDALGAEEMTFTVTIDMSSMYKRWIEIPVDTSNFELPKNVTVNNTSVKSVQIIGPEGSVKNVDDTVAYAVPNLEGVDLAKPGTYTVPAKIVFRALTNAWIYKTYQLEITVS